MASLGFPSRGIGENTGDLGQITREVDLMKSPATTGGSVGRLPRGSIVVLQGEQKNGYYLVQVELQDGKTVEGWVIGDSLGENPKDEKAKDKGKPQEKVKEPPKKAKAKVENGEEASGPVEQPKARADGKLRIPKDEGLLIQRDRSFIYGVQAGGNFNILQTNVDSLLYVGWGFNVGVHIGFYLSSTFPLHIEASYAIAEGTASDTGVALKAGFFNVAVLPHYLIDAFELFGGVQYGFGIGLGDIPQDSLSAQIASPSSLSSLYLVAGAGYRIPLGEVTFLVVRGRYSFAFLRAPIGIQIIALQLCLEFAG